MISPTIPILSGCLLLVGLAQAQVEQISAPITAAANPALGLPGTKVTLSGETPPVQPGAKVSLVITITPATSAAGSEDPEPIKREAELDAKGAWSLTLNETATIGRYAVAVTAPDGKGQAATQFDIVDDQAYEDGAQEQIAAMQKSVDATLGALSEHMNELIAGLPEGSEREETRRRFDIIDSKLKAVRHTLPNPLPKPLPPDTPRKWRIIIVSPIIENARALTVESDRVRIAIEASRAGAEICQRLDTAVEALNFTSSFSNFLAKNTEVLINHFTDKVVPALIELHPKSTSEGAKFVQAETGKVYVAAAQRGQNLVKSVPGLGLDLINYIVKDYYTKVCTRFEGPFTGTLKIDFFTDSSKRDPYWSYTTKVGGRMSLSQPKSFDGKSGSTMIGRVDGSGMGYQVMEDTLKLNPALRGSLIYHRSISPPEEISLPPIEMGALFNAITHPLGFQSVLRGERKEDQVIVNFDEAPLRDMSPNFNRTLVINVFSGGLIPVLDYHMLPMQGGHYILTRGMRKDAVLHLTTVGKEQHLKNTFTRTEDTGDISLRWDVEVDLCSPACSTTSIDRVKAWWEQGQAKQTPSKTP